ncbi:Two component transcriptional regulator, LuxR family OS=Tsukamurella paurometabola (strain ATCC 8368/ DSM / CCUG 35730 / CIP 100753 / JCM 10117 / KCTC 9821 / NBRC 16120 / NCIMB 702349 / NCTC 13040) OX=521096 GN=Tpau_0647 PE=4 SV=1 [Tsukamurella paurometabola]|uniref:Two component transcriptional regulator, LuxR family n=1 Tax=Tsukamurella paurometabola (strain ATCC 8368 / DSM 20162 / CCUG 35730 / CIP 100753 / JCM 10117 / KCTC 9821 / NBRC 16120 / NCIMB 702349 / NCTC 13040) TaxID=521096 RepID=D5USZ7_TSUPD|nr:response regulator transcription factor [Tsukamurella paurometabola]ADG77284.1 two component transcriptional regulator, LuxR family [Tsukamurella paurometabola DSM 20162]SUP43382.1 Response regulator protein vraR [Tsukamurella paurometabola]
MIRVGVVDDQAMFRSGLSMLIDSQADMENIGEAADGVEACALVRDKRPQVLLMDVRMPNIDGIEATAQIMTEPDPPAIIMLTTFDHDEAVARAMEAGAAGFLLKESQPQFVLAAIRDVAAGNMVVAASAARHLFAHPRPSTAPHRPVEFGRLTEREQQIFVRAAEGLSNAEIAEKEFLAETTVKTHVSRVLTKLGLRDRVQLVVYAHRHGLV